MEGRRVRHVFRAASLYRPISLGPAARCPRSDLFREEHHFLSLLALLGLTSNEIPMSKYAKMLRRTFYFFVVMGTVQYRPAFLH
jgi:hypothetical protein